MILLKTILVVIRHTPHRPVLFENAEEMGCEKPDYGLHNSKQDEYR